MKIGIVKMAAGKHREPNVERQFLPQGSELPFDVWLSVLPGGHLHDADFHGASLH